MRIRTRKYLTLLLLGFILWISVPTAQAQCPMCKINVKASMASGAGGKGFGLNQGITYLLAAPYLLAGVVGVAVYTGYRKRRKMMVRNPEDLMR